MNKLPIVERTDRICNLIKGEIEESDAEDYPDQDELISDQEDLMDDEEELEEESAPYTYACPEVSGTWIVTYDEKRQENKFTRFSEVKR